LGAGPTVIACILDNAQSEFPTDDACLERVMLERYGGTTIDCPSCGAEKSGFVRVKGRRAYACPNCGYHLYPCVGTVLERSRTNLKKWFHAMYLFADPGRKVPATELVRQFGVTYKCAWRMAHELRKLRALAGADGKLSGHFKINKLERNHRILGS
jgi:transposase-like protein